MEASAVVAWCVEGTEHSDAVCVRTSRAENERQIELSDGCGLGAEPDGVVPFDSCVSDKGCVVDVEHAPECSCWRQCSAESQGRPV